jgi:hypothetical protein
MNPDRLIKGDRDAGIENARWFKAYPELSSSDSKRQELLDFGFNEHIISTWQKGGRNKGMFGHAVDSCVASIHTGMQRLEPDGCTKLGLYIDGIRRVLHKNFDGGTILDFGCGPWPDASASFARDKPGFHVQLLDVIPMSLAFASYLLTKRDIAHTITDATGLQDELSLVADDVVMIVESTSFEHVASIRHLFEPLMLKLPKGGLFLTNYTKIGSLPSRDGYDECREFADKAASIAQNLAYRYKWEPMQPGGGEWDLWEIK